MSRANDETEEAARLREQLRRQLGYLERSSALFDSGRRDEAIRLATIDLRLGQNFTIPRRTKLSQLDPISENRERESRGTTIGIMSGWEITSYYTPGNLF